MTLHQSLSLLSLSSSPILSTSSLSYNPPPPPPPLALSLSPMLAAVRSLKGLLSASIISSSSYTRRQPSSYTRLGFLRQKTGCRWPPVGYVNQNARFLLDTVWVQNI